MTDKEICYKKIGTLCTQPDGVLSPVKVQAQQIYVVVGFGVNSPAAYKDGVHYLNVDPGHAFMYTVRNNKVTKFFSFGPRKHGEFANALGTPDYGMDYPTNLFKVPVSAEQMNKVEATVDKYRKEISDEKMKYRGVTNDTCAETVRQILSESGVSTPEGEGPVSYEISLPIKPDLSGGQWPTVKSNPSSFAIPSVGFGKWKTPEQKVDFSYPTVEGGQLPDFSMKDATFAPDVSAVNPYKWYDSFKKSGKYKEAQFEPQKKEFWSLLKLFDKEDPAAKKW